MAITSRRSKAKRRTKSATRRRTINKRRQPDELVVTPFEVPTAPQALPVPYGGNISGQTGPRCPACSGYGATLRIGINTCKAASRCNDCNGTGVDLKMVRDSVISDLQERVAALEAKVGELLNQGKE